MAYPYPNNAGYPCNDYGTVNISFIAPDITPKNGYKIKWKITTASEWNLYPNQYSSPITIFNVPKCYDLEVSIQADCDNGNVGQEIIVPIGASVTGCGTYVLTAAGTYTYVPCGQVTPVNQFIDPQVSAVNRTFCIKEGTITGGAYEYQGACAG